MGYWETQKERIDKEEKKRKENSSKGSWVKVSEGVTTVSIDLGVEPVITDGKFGKQHEFQLVEPANSRMSMTDKLFETFVKAVVGKKGIVKVNIVRTGTGR
jgi:hypothetical protein